MTVCTGVGKWLPTLPFRPTLAEMPGFRWTQLTNKLAPLFTTTKGRTPPSKANCTHGWLLQHSIAFQLFVASYAQSCANPAVAQMRGKKQVRSKVYTGALLFLFTVILYLFISWAISMLCIEVVFMHAFLTCNVTDVLLHCTVFGISFFGFYTGTGTIKYIQIIIKRNKTHWQQKVTVQPNSERFHYINSYLLC